METTEDDGERTLRPWEVTERRDSETTGGEEDGDKTRRLWVVTEMGHRLNNSKDTGLSRTARVQEQD